MAALVKAAEKEGQLNVITLPSNWANYGTIMNDFGKKYHIHINDASPVLLPSFLGCLLLLFGSSFSAYATAEALSGGTIALTPIQIGALLNGNVLAGQQNLGYALGLIMVVIIAIFMIAYTVLQRRAARWLR
jgi:putative spermidine/putrescine transport system permease protein